MPRDRYYYNSAKVESRTQSPRENKSHDAGTLDIKNKTNTTEKPIPKIGQQWNDKTENANEYDRLETEYLDKETKMQANSQLIRSLPAGKAISGTSGKLQNAQRTNNTALGLSTEIPEKDASSHNSNQDQLVAKPNNVNQKLNLDHLIKKGAWSKQQRSKLMSDLR